MLSYRLLQALFAATVCAAASLRRRDDQSSIVPNAYIVRFKGDGEAPVSTGNNNAAQVDDTVHTAFESYLAANKVQYSKRLKFVDKSIFYGYSLNLHDGSSVKDLEQFEEVDQVWPIREYKLASSQGHNGHQLDPRADVSDLLARAANATNTVEKDPRFQGPYAPHVMTGIDKVHAQGHLGAGLKIGIIDSGIDITHDALNGNIGYGNSCFGQPGCPVAGGAAFLPNNGSIEHRPTPQYDCPPSNSNDGGHGTHTGGILIRSPRDRNWPGVVPSAHLWAYRALSCGEDVPDDALLAALQQVAHDNVDLISYSIGHSSPWPETGPTADTISRIIDRGIAFIASVGNAGGRGSLYTASPSNLPGALGVGSVDADSAPGWTATVNYEGGSKQIVYLSANQFALNETKSFPVYATATDINTSDCVQLSNGTDLSKYVVVGPNVWNDCWYDLNALKDAGARIILRIMPDGISIQAEDAGPRPLPLVAPLSAEDGRFLLEKAAKGPVTIDFTNSQATTIFNSVTGGGTSSYSSYAVTFDLHMAVSVSGVGGSVPSTWPITQGKWAVLDGTSMSTPQVAGVYGLYKASKNSTESISQIRSVLTTTATPVRYSHATDVIDTPARHGGGLVNALKALNTPTRIWPDRLELNDTDHFNGTQTLTVTNVGTKAQHFTMAHLPAGTIPTFDPTGRYPVLGPIVPQKQGLASLSFEPASFSVGPGESSKVTVTVTPPATSQATLPMYSGYVQLHSDVEDGSLNVPYVGLAGSLKAVPVFNTTTDARGFNLPTLLTMDEKLVTGDTYTVGLTNFNDTVKIDYAFMLGLRKLTIDLVLANTTFVPSLPIPGNSGSSGQSAPGRRAPLRKEEWVAPIGRDAFQFNFRRGDDSTWWSLDPTLTGDDGTTYVVPSGKFRMLLRGLKLFGDEENEDDWESYLSVPFIVKRVSS